MKSTSNLDLDLSNVTKARVVDYDAFYNKVDNILSTIRGSVPFLRDFGLDLEQYLFRKLDYSTSNLISIEIENAILRYYPQASVEIKDASLDYNNRKYSFTILISHPKFSTPLEFNKAYSSNG